MCKGLHKREMCLYPTIKFLPGKYYIFAHGQCVVSNADCVYSEIISRKRNSEK